MGAALSAIAVKTTSAEAVQAALRLRPTGREDTFPGSKYSGASLPGGWYLICLWRHEFSDAELRQLSQGCELAACFVEEHVMVSKATGWREGRELWTVTHESEKGLDHLDVKGTPPPVFSSIRDEKTARQKNDNDCDCIFDIPVSLFAALTGFRYDADSAVAFEVLERPSFLSRLFGK